MNSLGPLCARFHLAIIFGDGLVDRRIVMFLAADRFRHDGFHSKDNVGSSRFLEDVVAL